MICNTYTYVMNTNIHTDIYSTTYIYIYIYSIFMYSNIQTHVYIYVCIRLSVHTLLNLYL